MFSYLLGIMAITIYNQSYGSTGVLNIMNRYDKIMGDAMKNTAFSSMIATIKGLAVGFTIILYLIDLSGKVTEKNFSIEQFFKATLRCVVTYMFIMNSSTIVGYLLDLGGAAAKEVSDQAGLDFFGGNEKSMLINGIAKMKITEILSYIVCSILPWLISMIAEVIIQVVLISRILEIITMTVLSPIAISDIYREGTSSNGVQFMKKMFALGLQVAVILVINTATQAIITQLVGSGYGISITNHLEKSQLDVGMNEGTAISQGSTAAFYPLKKFEYTDHQASIREIIVNGVNDIKESLSKLHDMLSGDEDDEKDSNEDTSQTDESAIKDDEIYPLIFDAKDDKKDNAVISNVGTIVNHDREKEIIENSDYRMTIQSTERFFDWCTGSDGSKEMLLLILLVAKVLLISTSAQMCNSLLGTSI